MNATRNRCIWHRVHCPFCFTDKTHERTKTKIIRLVAYINISTGFIIEIHVLLVLFTRYFIDSKFVTFFYLNIIQIVCPTPTLIFFLITFTNATCTSLQFKLVFDFNLVYRCF